MGEAANGKDAMDQIEKLQPQIVISDVVMPLMDGVDFTVAVHHRYPHIQMIILSGYDNFEYVKQTLMQGVVDFILKLFSAFEPSFSAERVIVFSPSESCAVKVSPPESFSPLTLTV